jgi:hypothetical protein
MDFSEKYGSCSVGYSNDFTCNNEYEEMGLCCPYEHCIENCSTDTAPSSCPVFGHQCPGGALQAVACSSDESDSSPWLGITKKYASEKYVEWINIIRDNCDEKPSSKAIETAKKLFRSIDIEPEDGGLTIYFDSYCIVIDKLGCYSICEVEEVE